MKRSKSSVIISLQQFCASYRARSADDATKMKCSFTIMRRQIQTVSGRLSSRQKCSVTSFEKSAEAKVSEPRSKLAWLQRRESRSGDKMTMAGLLEQLKLYCDNSSLAGCKYITELRRTWFERIMWVILHLIMACTLGTIVYNVLEDYKNTPVVTIVESDNFPSNSLPLPAVAVCSINRINRKAVVRLAERMVSAKITNLPFDKILNVLHELGYLYELSFDMEHENPDELDELLKKYFQGSYDPTQVMKELTPHCSDIMLKCSFRSQNRDCADLFIFRKTQDGFCCTFNYARAYDDITELKVPNHLNDPYKIETFGKINGLTFLMEPFLDDYFFPILPVAGWKITIFNPADYPDNTSGSVSDALISPGTENFLELSAVSFYSEDAVRRFDPNERRCIFVDEAKALFDGYTFSDCIVNCKVNDIFGTCGCRPFFYPRRNTRRVCNTSDVGCLHEFKSKWWSVLPHDVKHSKLFNIINESWSLHCKICYPSCNSVQYYLQSTSINLQKDKPTSFLRDIDIENQTLVHIFYSKYGTVRLKQDIVYYWYELLSNIGGICGVFIGFSLISAIELVYFLAMSGATLLCAKTRRCTSGSQVHVDDPRSRQKLDRQIDARSLYWAELAPRGKINNNNNAYVESDSRRHAVTR